MDVVIDDYIPRSIRGGAKGLNLLVAVATVWESVVLSHVALNNF